VAKKLIRLDDGDLERGDELARGVAVGLRHICMCRGELGDVLVETGAHRFGVAVVDFEAGLLEFEGETTHRGDEKMGTLNVPRTRGDLARRFDDQDPVGFGLGRGERADFSVQLVAEDPHGS